MGVGVKREVSISSPFTLQDMQQFIDAAKVMGVNTAANLRLQVSPAGGDQRESWPASAVITAAGVK